MKPVRSALLGPSPRRWALDLDIRNLHGPSCRVVVERRDGQILGTWMVEVHYYTVVKVNGATPKRWRFVRGHDKPIHRSCPRNEHIYNILNTYDI